LKTLISGGIFSDGEPSAAEEPLAVEEASAAETPVSVTPEAKVGIAPEIEAAAEPQSRSYG
jgi:hypothetical protein